MSSIFGDPIHPRSHVRGHPGPADEFPELTAELMEDKLRGRHAPNTGKPLREREWKRIDYIAPPRLYGSHVEPQLADFTVTVLDEKRREEHRFRVHRVLIMKMSKFFEASQKPAYAVCTIRITMHVRRWITDGSDRRASGVR
jgi:hypothetical protein